MLTLPDILRVMKNARLYSEKAWLEYVDCFENAESLHAAVAARPSHQSDELRLRITGTRKRPDEPFNPAISPKLVPVTELPGHHTGKTVGVVSGCYDLLHRGHAISMRYARECLSGYPRPVLYALTMLDADIERSKGSGRPVLNVNERLTMIAAIRYVDHVVVLGEPHCLGALGALAPDLYFKTKEDLTRAVVRREAEIVKANGGSVHVFPEHVSNIISTTEIIAGIKGGVSSKAIDET